MRALFRIGIILALLALTAAGAYLYRNYLQKKRLMQAQEKRFNLFEAEVRAAALRHGVDKELIKAVIWRESNFDPDAKGLAGERGLMQIMPAAADDFVKFAKVENFQYDDLFKPEVNVDAGTWYLGRALKRWEGRDNPLPFALAEYNAGRKHALRWAAGDTNMTAAEFITNIDFPTTRSYVTNIINKYQSLRNETK
ncbi:transglycosylase SLT domain-containing protein [Oscillatoria amoena NRMC-F 0135]|nr:transglycosylase SLT domain-containing protein [Oscillatoria amoena NRMC-F 0135]